MGFLRAAHSAPASAFRRAQEDPFLLLQSCSAAIAWILLSHAGRPLRRSWIEHPYGEEEITLLEEEVLPAIQQCLARIEAIDAPLAELLEGSNHKVDDISLGSSRRAA